MFWLKLKMMYSLLLFSQLDDIRQKTIFENVFFYHFLYFIFSRLLSPNQKMSAKDVAKDVSNASISNSIAFKRFDLIYEETRERQVFMPRDIIKYVENYHNVL